MMCHDFILLSFLSINKKYIKKILLNQLILNMLGPTEMTSNILCGLAWETTRVSFIYLFIFN